VDLWAAPYATAPVSGVVHVPGSKSQTNRALILAALAGSPSRVIRPLRARDTELMAAALVALGCRITDIGATADSASNTDRPSEANPRPSDDWYVEPSSLHGPADVDCGLAGTVMRFVPAIAGLATGPIRFDGDFRARRRPMSTMLDALRQVGIEVDDEGSDSLPFTVKGDGNVRGGDVEIDASASSQFISALLLAGARYAKGVRVTHVGTGAIPSLPHVGMTLEMLRERGLVVASDRSSWSVEPAPIPALDVTIEPDLSNAAPFLAAALVTGGAVTIPGWSEHSTQPGASLPELLSRMGATISNSVDGLTLTGAERLLGLEADLHEVGELTPVLAACCALATTASRLTGIAHLRGHETDRLAALATEFNALGGDVEATRDTLIIRPKPLRAGTFHTYDDHRLATAGAVIGLRVADVLVENIETTGKTLPRFAATWLQLVSGSEASARVPKSTVPPA
jgi:3-phosphoshikimate 1-carboxyvinyltransferase